MGGDVEGFHGIADAKGNGHGEGGQLGAAGFGGVQKGECEILPGFGEPTAVVSTTACGLCVCRNDRACWNILARGEAF